MKLLLTDCLTHKLAFDLSKLYVGDVVQLITPRGIDKPIKDMALIKDISVFSITLILIEQDTYNSNIRTGKTKEKIFPISAFEGTGCYALKRLQIDDGNMDME